MSFENTALASIDEIEARSRSAGWNLEYVRLNAAPSGGTVRIARVGPMRVLRQDTEGALHVLGGAGADGVVFGLPVGELTGARWRLAELGGDDLFTTPSASDFDLLTRGRASFYGFLVPRRELAELSGDLDRWFPHEGAWRSHLRLEAHRAKDLRELFECILEGPVEEDRARELGTLLMQSILTATDHAGEPRRPDSGSRADQADLARRYIEDHLAESLKVEDIAGAAGVGVRTLQRCFREIFGLTPLSYIKARRLDRVRRGLRAPSRETQVSAVAMSHGLTHMGRFSQEYRQMYGELPRETLATRRRAGEPVFEVPRPTAWGELRPDDTGPAEPSTRVSGDR